MYLGDESHYKEELCRSKALALDGVSRWQPQKNELKRWQGQRDWKFDCCCWKQIDQPNVLHNGGYKILLSSL